MTHKAHGTGVNPLYGAASPIEAEAFEATIRRCHDRSERLGLLAERYLRTGTNGRLLRQPTETTAVVIRRDIARGEIAKVLEVLHTVLYEDFGVSGAEVQSAVLGPALLSA